MPCIHFNPPLLLRIHLDIIKMNSSDRIVQKSALVALNNNEIRDLQVLDVEKLKSCFLNSLLEWSYFG